jgi:hypothetical protein
MNAPDYGFGFLKSWHRQIAADRRLNGVTARTAMAVSWYVNQDSGEAWPSVQTLAGDVSSSARSVQRALGLLEALGHLKIRSIAGKPRVLTPIVQVVEAPDNLVTADNSVAGGVRFVAGR